MDEDLKFQATPLITVETQANMNSAVTVAN